MRDSDLILLVQVVARLEATIQEREEQLAMVQAELRLIGEQLSKNPRVFGGEELATDVL